MLNKNHILDSKNPISYVENKYKKFKKSLLILTFQYYALNLFILLLSLTIGIITALRLGNKELFESEFKEDVKKTFLIIAASLGSLSATISGFISFFVIKDKKIDLEQKLATFKIELFGYKNKTDAYATKINCDMYLLTRMQKIFNLNHNIVQKARSK